MRGGLKEHFNCRQTLVLTYETGAHTHVEGLATFTLKLQGTKKQSVYSTSDRSVYYFAGSEVISTENTSA